MNRKDRKFRIGTVVRHFKGGKLYRIEDFVRHTETGEMMVIYRQGYPPYMAFARPEANFCSRVDRDKYPDATQEFRFEAISKEEAKGKHKQEAPREPQNGQQEIISGCCAGGNTGEPERRL